MYIMSFAECLHLSKHSTGWLSSSWINKHLWLEAEVGWSRKLLSQSPRLGQGWWHEVKDGWWNQTAKDPEDTLRGLLMWELESPEAVPKQRTQNVASLQSGRLPACVYYISWQSTDRSGDAHSSLTTLHKVPSFLVRWCKPWFYGRLSVL